MDWRDRCWRVWIRGLIEGVILFSGAVSLVVWPVGAPGVVLLGVLPAAWATVMGWKSSGGTALRPAVGWGAAAWGLGGLALLVALREPMDGGRPWSGHLVYLANLLMLAALTSVLNARKPGNGAWAMLMGLLVLVLLIPWLEGIGLARGVGALARLRLEAPWSWFFGLIALVGLSNYLPTRYAPAVLVAGIGMGAGWVGLARPELSPATRAGLWTASAWGLIAVPTVAGWSSRRGTTASGPLDRLWLGFRDHWGVVWGLRVAERFNRSAEAVGWPIRLGWQGVEPVPPSESAETRVEEPEGAAEVFRGLLRRFLTPEVADRWAEPPEGPGRSE